jgi:Ca2+-binding EF-hand superfamily protein
MNRQIARVVPVLVASVVVLSGAFVHRALSAPNVLSMLDSDKDGTVDLTEAKAAGAAAFDRLEKDHDGTLDRGELRGRIDPKGVAVADPDKDGTLDKGEYLALIEQRFKVADRDNDGTLDAAELKSSAGQALIRLVK